MRLKSVALQNIRSYEHERVEFPEGSVLLSGDVGSGKSSLLLAIEFALFGIKRGELSGEALLRRGQKSGTVTLNFTLDSKDITIERTLTRTPSGVRQDAGHITIDGLTRAGTATELKATVLDLLGYPQELIQKQKSLLYRYTVYTPQEQMKDIIKADTERRLDTLRKLFRVNRYKIIRENIKEFLRDVRSKKRELRMLFRDLSDKKQKRAAEKTKLDHAKKSLKTLKKQEDSIQQELEKWRTNKKGIEDKIEQFNRYDKKLSNTKTSSKNIKDQLDPLVEKIKKTKTEIDKLAKLEPPTKLSDEQLEKSIDAHEQKKEEFLKDPHGIDDEMDRLLKQKESLQKKIEEAKNGRTQAQTRIEALNESIQKLVEAEDVCPVCGQNLDEEHRQNKIIEYNEDISKKEQTKNELKSQLTLLADSLKKTEETIQENVTRHIGKINSQIKNLKKTREELRDYRQKMQEKERLGREIKEHQKKKETLEAELTRTATKIKDLTSHLEKLKGVKEQKDQIEKQIEEINKKLRDVTGRIKGTLARQDEAENRLKELKEEIQKMESAQKFERKLSGYESWFADYLSELAGTIERHFMLELRHQFDPLFRNWFNLLIEDELLNVRIDDTFSPIIEQEGYEAEYENLSGGESASLALAYRLALNKVINTLVEEIKSNDIIILDEPTDGFSNDQLDKIRDIIAELSIPQTIIVSHEPKVESYVENIIRIRKEGGISRVL